MHSPVSYTHLGFGFNDPADNIELVQLRAGDDERFIRLVERLERDAVGTPVKALEGALAVAVNHHAHVAVLQRLLAADKGEVAVVNIGLHGIAPDDKVKIPLRRTHAGRLAAHMLLKGESVVARAHRADNGHEHGAGEAVARQGGGQAQQIVHAHAVILRQPQQHGVVGQGLARLPFRHRLLGDVQLPGESGLGQVLFHAQFFQPRVQHCGVLLSACRRITAHIRQP